MSNINVKNCSSSLEFLGDYEIESVEMNGDELNGESIMRLLIDDEEYEMRVSMKEGKKEGTGLLLRKNGILFMRMMFVNDECKGEVTKMNKYGNTVLKGRVSKGRKEGMWIEYDDYGNEKWRGLYRNGKRYSILKEQEGMKGFYSEMNVNGDLLSVSEYEKYGLLKNGKCIEYEGGRLVRECEYKNGVMMRVLREWKGEMMIEYDMNGMKVYEGGFGGDMKEGYKRDKEGTEYDSDGTTLYVGHYVDGERSGYGTEYKGCYAWYIGNWKNGKRSGKGKEYDENEHVVKDGEWIDGRWEEDVKLDKLKEKYREMELKQKKMKESNRGIIFLIIGAVLSL